MSSLDIHPDDNWITRMCKTYIKNNPESEEFSQSEAILSALIIIAGLGGIAVALAGFAGLHHAGALSHLSQYQSVSMMVYGAEGAAIIIGIGASKFQINQNKADEPESPQNSTIQ